MHDSALGSFEICSREAIYDAAHGCLELIYALY